MARRNAYGACGLRGVPLVRRKLRRTSGREWSTDPPTRSVCAAVVAVGKALLVGAPVALLLSCGCAPTSASSEQPKPEGRDAAVTAESPCAFLVLSQIGIDPAEVSKHSGGAVSALDAVRDAAQAHGKPLTSIGFDEYLERSSTLGAVLLEYPNDGLQVSLGTFVVDGEQYVQRTGMQAAPELVRVPKAGDGRPLRVWVPAHERAAPVELSVGGSRVVLNKLWHSFGVTTPLSGVTETFRVTNSGPEAVRLSSIGTSCGCTTVKAEGDGVLEPGEFRDLPATVKTGDQTSFKQTVTLSIVEQRTLARRDVTFVLFGNQVQILTAAPSEITFGRVRRHSKPLTRTLRLSSSSHDPFEVTSVRPGPSLPLSCDFMQIDPERASGEPAAVITLTLDPRDLGPGTHKSVLQVASSSRYRPFLSVPVGVTVLPHVEAFPGIAAFGRVPAGSVSELKVSLASDDGRPFSVEVADAPADCEVDPVCDGRQCTVGIRASFSSAGAFERRVKLKVRSETWTEDVELPCFAVVSPAKP